MKILSLWIWELSVTRTCQEGIKAAELRCSISIPNWLDQCESKTWRIQELQTSQIEFAKLVLEHIILFWGHGLNSNITITCLYLRVDAIHQAYQKGIFNTHKCQLCWLITFFSQIIYCSSLNNKLWWYFYMHQVVNWITPAVVKIQI